MKAATLPGCEDDVSPRILVKAEGSGVTLLTYLKQKNLASGDVMNLNFNINF